MIRTCRKKGLIQMNFNEKNDSRQTDQDLTLSMTFEISQADQSR